MTGNLQSCERCAQPCLDQSRGLCDVFGIANRRLVATGFLLYDPTSDTDVPELDACGRPDCPGLVRGDAA